MVYIKSWTAFHAAAVELQLAQPERTRYVIKSHPSTQELVLKLTDDKQTIKFRTRSAIILNRFQALTSELLAIQADAPKPSVAAVAASAEAAAAVGAAKEAQPQTQQQGKTGAKQGGAGAGGGGGKKKKGKGGKK